MPLSSGVSFFVGQLWWKSGGQIAVRAAVLHPGTVTSQPAWRGLHWLLLHLPLHPLHHVHQTGKLYTTWSVLGSNIPYPRMPLSGQAFWPHKGVRKKKRLSSLRECFVLYLFSRISRRCSASHPPELQQNRQGASLDLLPKRLSFHNNGAGFSGAAAALRLCVQPRLLHQSTDRTASAGLEQTYSRLQLHYPWSYFSFVLCLFNFEWLI